MGALASWVAIYAYIVALGAALLSFVYNSIRMARSAHASTFGPRDGRNRKPNYNPFNVIFSPADLTPRGRRYRASALLAFFSFLGLLWFGVILKAWL